MTTFQDPPAQSRRAARQSERGERPDDPTPFGTPVVSQQFTADPFMAQGGFPAATQPPVQSAAPIAQQAPPAATGRRARAAQPQGLFEVPPTFTPTQPAYPEPLNYSTQGAQPVAPQYQAPPVESAPYRVRDFSPEGRRAATPPPLEEPQSWLPGGGYAPPSDLDYRTQASPFAASGASAATSAPLAPTQAPQQPQQYVAPPVVRPAALFAPAPAPAPAPAAGPAPTQTLTRKEMRALRGDEEVAYDAVGSPGQLQTQAPYPAQPSALENAMAEFDVLTKSGQLAPPMANQRVDEPAPKQQYSAPVGHWSRQADLEDETQPYENTITREVGVSNVATTTSALVLPSIPTRSDFPTALNSTGEILFTGSIELPKSLGSLGGDARRYDDPNVDLFFDSQDREVASTDSSPVKAIKAVSTHTSTRGVIQTTKPKGGRTLTVLLVTASILAVGVVGLFVASIVFHLF